MDHVCQTRYKFGSLVQNEPSRFINELPEKYLDRSFAGGGVKNQTAYGSAYARMNRGFGASSDPEWLSNSQKENQSAGQAGKKPSYLTPRPQTKEHIPSADFTASDTSNLQVGQKIEHQKFGFGEVIKMEGAAHNPIATVKFELNGEKKIMLNYAKLRIIEG